MEKSETIVVVLFASFVLLLVGGFLLFALIWYRKRTNMYIGERNNMKNEFERQILQVRLEIQEQTLNNISREIHDSVGQNLSLAKIQLNIIEVSEGLSKDVLQGAKESLSKAIVELRDIARGMSSERARLFNLHDSIEEELGRIRQAGLMVCSLVSEGQPRELEAPKKLILFRIIQENLQNILRHARAKEISLVIEYLQTTMQVTISDDGSGFDVPDALAKHAGMGLRNIISRSELLNGKAEITSTPGKGTTVKIIIPYD